MNTVNLRAVVCGNRGGRMTKWKGKITSTAPMALMATVSVAALSLGSAQATTISTAETTPQIFMPGEDHTVTTTGSISVTTTSAPAAFIVPDFANAFINNGTINVATSSNSFAAGIFLPGNLLAGGSIENNGTIDIQANASFTASAYGIFVTPNISIEGSISNSGTITASAQSTSSGTAQSYGIYIANGGIGGPLGLIGGGLSGSISNSGTINVQALASSSSANAYGIYVEPNVGLGGSVDNSGTINVFARTASSTVEAYGVLVSRGRFNPFGSPNDGLFGSINNSGTIDVHAISSTSANAYGISVQNSVAASGSIDNSGTITVLAETTSSNSAEAYGIHISGGGFGPFSPTIGFAGSIDNSGTIDVQARAASYATAYGIYIEDGADAGSIVTNSGTITAFAHTTSNSTAAAYGVYVASGLVPVFSNPTGGGVPIAFVPDGIDADFVNSGTISAEADAYSSAAAYGYHLRGDLNGSFDNSGTISATATANSSETAQAYGLYVSGDANGFILNSGSVLVQANGFSSATATGFHVDMDLNGGFDNTGTIVATALDQTDMAEAFGLYVGGIANSQINNTGTITAISTATEDTAQAAGIHMSNGVSSAGGINNSGTISASARNLTSNSATAYGVAVLGDLDGVFDNSGTISASAFASSTYEAAAFGLYVFGNANADVMNSGTIRAQGIGVTSATVYGVNVSGDLNANLSNSGTIATLAFDDNSSADSAAIYVEGDINGSISNSGTLIASAVYLTGFATAGGIYTDGSISGDVSNSGTITVGVNGSSGSAIGVSAASMTGNFANSGTITAIATGGSANAIAVNFDSFDGTITDVGTISATSQGGNAYAIYLGTGSGTLNVDSFDNVNGLIRVADHDVNLTSLAGSSAIFEFEDANTAGGVFTTIEQGGAPWFVQDEGGANPIYSTYGQSSFSDQSLGVNQALGLSSFLGKLSSSVGNGTASKDTLTFSSKGTGFGQDPTGSINYYPFIQATRAEADYNIFAGSDSHVGTAALQTGALVELNNGGTVGGMLSVIDIHSSSVVPATGAVSNTSEGKGFALDLTYTPDLSFATVTFGLSTGNISNEQQRIVGATTASSEFDSRWFGINAEISKSYAWKNNWFLTPSGKLSISSADFDGYTETGSAAGLATVSGRTATATSGEIGLKASKAFDAGVLIAGASLFATNWSGDDTSNVTLFGQTQAVSAANQDLSGAKFTLDLDNIRIGKGDLSIKTGLALDDDGGIEKTLTARYQIRF